MNVGASGHKNKIILVLIAISAIALNLAFISPAKAAISAGSLISMTNSARASAGLKPYTVNSALTSSAYAKAQDMLKYDYFAHYSPQGKSPWSFIKVAGYTYTFAGENLAIDFSDNSKVFAAWMASPTHRSNILDKDFTEIGMAAVTGEYQGHITTVIVQHFGVRAFQTISSPVKNIKIQSTNDLAKPKQVQKPIKIKLNLSVSQNPSFELSQNSISDIIWYTSPALYLIKTLS